MAPAPRSLTCALAVVALLASGCLGGEKRSSRIAGDSATIYASLPRSGVSAPAARAAAAGARLALDEAGRQAGGLKLRLVELDPTERGERLWSPNLVSANAERVADDPKAIAYLGELDYGGSAVSLPITNDAGLLQVSPSDGLTSLTATPAGRPRAGPERYHPTGERSFVRLVPTDQLEAETLLAQARASGVRRMAVLFDADVYGRELGGQLSALGRRDGPEPVVSAEYRGRVEEIPELVGRLAEEDPEAVVYASISNPGTGRLLAAIDARMPRVPVYATAGILARDPAAPIPVAPYRVEAIGPVPPPDELPRAGRRVLARVRRAAGPRAARSEAVYGYEAMRLVLDAVRAAGPDREKVRQAALRIRERTSPLGRYRVRGTGDVDGEEFALYSLRAGRFRFERMVE